MTLGDVGPDYTVTLNSSITIDTLDISTSDATLALSRTLTANGGFWNSGNIHLSGGNLSTTSLISNSHMITGSGWLTAQSSLINDPGAVINLTGGGLNVGTLTNGGEITLTGGSAGVGGNFTNEAGAVLNTSVNFNIGGAANNLGTINLTGGSINNSGGLFNNGVITGRGSADLSGNSGTISATQSGYTLSLPLKDSFTNSGTFQITDGATLSLSGSGKTVTNSGTIDFGGSSAKLTIGSGVTFIENNASNSYDGLVDVYGTFERNIDWTNWGLLTLNSAAARVEGTGTLTNEGTVYTLGGRADCDFVNNGTLNVGSTTCYFQKAFTQNGTINLAGGSLDTRDAVDNPSGAEISGHGSLVLGSNAGTLHADGGTLALTILNDLHNTGSIAIEDGSTLSFSGSRTITNDAALDFRGSTAALTINGGQTFLHNSTGTTFDGRLNVYGGFQASADWTNLGTITLYGTIGGGGRLTNSGAMTLHGTMATDLGNTSTLEIPSSALLQGELNNSGEITGKGTLTVDWNGSISSLGTVRPTGGTDDLVLRGDGLTGWTQDLGGHLDLTSGDLEIEGQSMALSNTGLIDVSDGMRLTISNTNGDFTNTGTVRIGSNAYLYLYGSGSEVTNQGTIEFMSSDSRLSVGSGTTFVNDNASSGFDGTTYVYGTFRGAVPTTNSGTMVTYGTIEGTLNNTGTLEIPSSALLQGELNNSGEITGKGTLTVDWNGSISSLGTVRPTGWTYDTLRLRGDGLTGWTQDLGGHLDLTSGDLEIEGQSMALSNTGLIDVSDGRQLTIDNANGGFTNTGTVRIGTNAYLSLYGSGSEVTNQGTIDFASSNSRLYVQSGVTLSNQNGSSVFDGTMYVYGVLQSDLDWTNHGSLELYGDVVGQGRLVNAGTLTMRGGTCDVDCDNAGVLSIADDQNSTPPSCIIRPCHERR